MSVTDVTEATFEEKVMKSNIPVLIDVWAAWCGPCRALSPIIEEVSADYEGKVTFVKVDADSNEKIAERYNITSIPSILLVVKGRLKAMGVGAMQKEALKKWIDKNL